MKTSKTETLKECLTNPDIVDYINTENNFSICRPYHNKTNNAWVTITIVIF